MSDLMLAPGHERWDGKGSSEAAEAAANAVREALGGREPTSDDLVIVFCDAALDGPQVVEAAASVASPATVVAGSATGAFASGSPKVQPCVALHLPATEVRTAVAWAEAGEIGLPAACDRAVRDAREAIGEAGPHSALMLLSDGHPRVQRDVLRAAYHVTGLSVPIAGGVVGSVAHPDGVWLSVDGRILRQAVVAIWISSRTRVAVAVDHGWRPAGRPLHVTATDGSLIVEMDGRPAMEAYLEATEVVERQVKDLLGPVDRLAFGIPTGEGTFEVRMFGQLSEAGVELYGQVPEQSIVRLMAITRDGLLDGTRQAIRRAVEQLSAPPRAALVFSCACRYGIMLDDGAAEVSAVDEVLDVPAIGFFTHGEFGTAPGSPGFHNASVSVLAL